jgi:hypothetical protein
MRSKEESHHRRTEQNGKADFHRDNPWRIQ